jgi:hypothetical protein
MHLVADRGTALFQGELARFLRLARDAQGFTVDVPPARSAGITTRWCVSGTHTHTMSISGSFAQHALDAVERVRNPDRSAVADALSGGLCRLRRVRSARAAPSTPGCGRAPRNARPSGLLLMLRRRPLPETALAHDAFPFVSPTCPI